MYDFIEIIIVDMS